MQNHEFDLIEKTLKAHQGNRQQVAAILGVSERTLRYKLAKMREEGYVCLKNEFYVAENCQILSAGKC